MDIHDLQRWYAESKLPELDRVSGLIWETIDHCYIREPVKLNEVPSDASVVVDYGVIALLIPKDKLDFAKDRKPIIAILDKNQTRFIWRIIQEQADKPGASQHLGKR